MKNKIETKVVINNKNTELIGKIKDIEFYRVLSDGDDIVYVVEDMFVIGKIECSMGQGFGYIDTIEEL